MATLVDKFKDLKNSIVGTTTTKIDMQLDKAVKDIVAYKSQSGRNGYIELMRSLISKTADINITSGTTGIFGQGITPASFGQSGRLMRYRTYEAIVSHINYCYRALSVLIDNIISPDDITKSSLEIKPKTYLEDEVSIQSKVKLVEEIVKELKLEDKLSLIVRSTLELGDFFCEIGDEKTALTSRSILTETEYDTYIGQQLEDGVKEKITFKEGEETHSIVMDYSYFIDEKNKPKKKTTKKITKKEKEKLNVKNLKLILHEPKFVVKLQSSLFPLCFGYLIFPQIFITQHSTFEDDTINNLCNDILKSLAKKIPQVKEFAKDDDLKDIIAAMLKHSDPSRIMDIRYVGPDNMVHFQVPSNKYYPYGESVFDSCQFMGKCLIAMETALAIQRLSRSTEKRKIAVEIGLPRDAKKAIEALKEEFRKRKISLDSFGTIDTIPSMITTFEDIYIPQKDGKPYVDVSSFSEGNVDVRNKVDELKFLRDQLVSSLGIPPSFIGIEENLCLFSDTYISLINGDKLKLSEIIEQFDKGVNDIYVYSYDNETGRIVPGLITWAGYTKLQTKVIRVHLDNGKYIDCTPEHPFMFRDGTYIEAQLLKENDSLMPFYVKSTKSSMSSGITYELVYHPGLKNKNWQLTYHMVADSFNKKYGKGYVIHHDNYNPRNNHPDNLTSLTNVEHNEIHGSDKVRHTPGGTLYIDEICIICNTIFTRAFNINKITCSDKCMKKYREVTGMMSWKSREQNYPERTISCALCGKERSFKQKDFNELKFYSCQTNEKCTKFVRGLNNTTKQGTILFCEIEYSECETCGKSTIISDDKYKILNTCNNIKCINTVLARRGAEKKKALSRQEFICEFCEDSFTKARWEIENRKYPPTCGKKECLNKQLKNIQSERYKDSRTTVDCCICGDKIIVTKAYKERTRFIHCEKEECKKECMSIRSSFGGQANKERIALNHKVVKVEILEGLHDTGDITVEGYHNFAVEAGVIVHNSNKSALTEENVLFARTIVSHQKYFNYQIVDLIKKVIMIASPEEALTLLDDVDISFPVPRSLQYEREARYMGEFANLVETLDRIGIPKEYSRKKFLSQIDWEEVKKYDIDSKIDKGLDPKKAKEDDDSGMAGMGGGMGGF